MTMTLKEIIVGFEGAIKLFQNSYSSEKYQMEVILTLAKEIQALKDKETKP